MVQWLGLHAVTAKRDMSLLTSKDRQDCPESQKTQREREREREVERERDF